MIRQRTVSMYLSADHPQVGANVYVVDEPQPYTVVKTFPKGRNMLLKRDGKQVRLSKTLLYMSPNLTYKNPIGLKLKIPTSKHPVGKFFPFEETHGGELYVNMSTIKGQYLIWAHLGIDSRRWEIVYD